MKRWSVPFLIIGIFAYLALILYTNRASFTSRFNADYWKDRYEHSQWKLPVSTRTIGDDGLFLYEGYRLIRGDNPADYNAEVPPIGKYLIGLSILIFGNGYWYGFIITSLATLAFFLLARTLQINSKLSFAITLLFLTDPLITGQFPVTLLGSLQLLFLLGTFLFLTHVTTAKRYASLFAIALGISFGLFSGAKTPLYSPFIGIIVLVVLWMTRQSIKTILLFLGGALAAYLTPYLPYFLQGHSFTEWIVMQKWMIGFFRSSLLSPNTGSAITSLLFNRTQNLFSRVWEGGDVWSPAWPLITIVGIGSLFFKKNRLLIPIIISVIVLLIVLSLIPFWTRYLLLIVPLLYLAAAGTLTKLKIAPIIFFIILTANVMGSVDILFPTPQATVKTFTYAWEHGFFQDMYEELATSSKTTDRQSFHRLGLQAYYDGQIEGANIEIVSPRWSRFESPQSARLRITYFTRELGSFSEQLSIPVIKENGRWVIPWQWEYLMEGFDETKHLETTVIPARRGSIIGSDGTILAQDTPGVMVWITPENVEPNKEEAMLTSLETAFNRHPGAVSIHHRYVGNALLDLPIPVGAAAASPTMYPGMTITPHLVRVPASGVTNAAFDECCSFLYSTTNYDGLSGPEQQYNDRLKGKNGGRLVIKDTQGNVVRTILDLPKQDGGDALLEVH